MRRLLPVLMLSTAIAPASAAEPVSEPATAGTEAGAGELAKTLAAYVGQAAIDTNVLKIAPDPAGYRITIDLSKVLPALLPPNTKVEIPPYDLIVGPRPDGDWNVAMGGFPKFSYSIQTGDVSQSGSYMPEGVSFTGVYAPEIASFLSGKGTIAKARATSTDPLSTSETEWGRANFEIAGSKAEGGAADWTVHQTIDGFSERRELRAPDLPPEARTPIIVKGGKLESVVTAKAFRSRAMADFQAFLVAHPDLLSPEPDPTVLSGLEGEFKAKLRAILPLWQHFTISAKGDGLSGETGFGTFTAGSADYGMSMDGLAKDATWGLRTSLNGLDIVSPFIPAWTRSLIPQDVALNFSVEKLDLQTPVEIALSDFSLTKPKAQFDAIGRRAEAAFEASPPSFTIEPSRIKATDLDLSFNGAVIIAKPRPTASFSIAAKGLDRTIETLKRAAEKAPEANQAIGILSIAKGFGKAMPDGQIQWVVNAEPDGSVSVNGVQVKGPQPVARDDDDDGDDDAPDEGIAPDGEVPMDQAPTDDNALPDAPPKP